MANLLFFDGTNTYVDIPVNLNALTAGTVEMWVRPTDLAAARAAFAEKDASTGVSHSIGLLTTGIARAFVFDGTTRGRDSQTTATAGEWVHLAFAWKNDDAVTIYVNACLENSRELGTAWASGTKLRIGDTAADALNDRWKGEICEVRVWDHRRSQMQLGENMHARLTGAESGLVHLYPLNEGSGTTATDLCGGASGTIVSGTWSTDDDPTTAPPATAAVAEVASGLIFADDFDRASLGADWTAVQGTWPLSGDEVSHSPTVDDDRLQASVLAAASGYVIQCEIKTNSSSYFPGLLNRWDTGTTKGYLLHHAVGALALYRYSGSYTLLSTLVCQIDANERVFSKFQVANGLQKSWLNAGAFHSLADATHDAVSGKAGLRGGGHTGTGKYDNFYAYAGNTIAMSGLPTGYSIRYGNRTASESSGTATLDLAGFLCPVYRLEVLDATSAVVDSIVPANGVYGGGTYTYTSPAPEAPTGIVATSSTPPRQITVTWDAVAGVTSYEVHMSTTAGFTPDASTKWADVAAGTTTVTFTNNSPNSIAPSTVYYVRVLAVNGAGSTASVEASTTTPANLAPNTPVVRIVNITSNSVTFAWD